MIITFKKIDWEGRDEKRVKTLASEALEAILPYLVGNKLFISKHPRKKSRTYIKKLTSSGVQVHYLRSNRGLFATDHWYGFVINNVEEAITLISDDYPDERYYRVWSFRSIESAERLFGRAVEHYTRSERSPEIFAESDVTAIVHLCLPEGWAEVLTSSPQLEEGEKKGRLG